MKDSLVSLNIISKNTLLNKNGVPILFYWDGTKDIIQSICEDESFASLIRDTVFNYENYANVNIALFYFKFEDDKEVYKEEILKVQDLWKLANIDDDHNNFYKNYLWKHFAYLYNTAYHEDYQSEASMFDIDECILDIYDKIQEKYPKRVIKSTVVNYIRGELQNKDNLSMENTNWIIFKLEALLTERE